jgi:hypothetical protein
VGGGAANFNRNVVGLLFKGTFVEKNMTNIVFIRFVDL